jgi:DNA-damage-inducible protein D
MVDNKLKNMGGKQMTKLETVEYLPFEEIKQVDENGEEFWYARELQEVLKYTQWRNFQKIIDRAILACQNIGMNSSDQFVDVSKLIKMAKKAERKIIDYKLTRYACYLIVQIADKIRSAMINMGTTLPENLPIPVKSIQVIEREEIKKLRNYKGQLMLDE